MATDDRGTGELNMTTGGFDAKFLPSGSAGDDVTYTIEGTDTPSTVKVAAKGTTKVVLPRVDVDDVKVDGGGAGTQTVSGLWNLERWDGAAWSQVRTSSGAASRLPTKRGLYVLGNNKYRATITYKTSADPNNQTKVYEVSFP